MNLEAKAGTYTSLKRCSTPDSVTALLHSTNASVPSKGSQIPGELLAIVLEYLCSSEAGKEDDYKEYRIDIKLAQCSLTCRHWAANIRPRVFSRITLTSGKRARTFSALVCSSVHVPAPLRDNIRYLRIKMNDAERPWLFYIGAIFRGAGLPNIEWAELIIKGVDGYGKPQMSSGKGELLLDIGLPRKVPSAQPIRLHALRLEYLQFRSYPSLLRSLGWHFPNTVKCEFIRWPAESPVVAPAEYLHRQLSSHTPEKVWFTMCPVTAVMPFIWSLVTPEPPGPSTKHQLLHISSLNIVMSILGLFSSECKCGRCRSYQDGSYVARVYSGAFTYRSPIKPTYSCWIRQPVA